MAQQTAPEAKQTSFFTSTFHDIARRDVSVPSYKHEIGSGTVHRFGVGLVVFTLVALEGKGKDMRRTALDTFRADRAFCRDRMKVQMRL